MKQTNRLTNIQEIQNYLDLVYKHIWKASKNFREIYPTELEISLYEPNFSKEVSQLAGCRHMRNLE